MDPTRIPIEDIQSAAERIEDWIHHTPLLSSRRLGEEIGARLWVKAECLQKTGSFKPRGAVNRLLTLSDEQRAAGVVTVSAGNHAQGLAYAAGRLGVSCTVVMPESAPTTKVDAAQGYGAKVILHGTVGEAFDKAMELANGGLTLAHPYDDLMVIGGQGTVGLEILEDLDDFDVVVVPIGGGGLISGIASAVKARRPGVRIYGVEPHGASAITAARTSGQPVPIEPQSIADGLMAPIAGLLTLEVINDLVDDVVLVDDHQIASAMAAIANSTKLVTEGAGAAAIAALRAGLIPLDRSDTVVAVLSGGNIEPAHFGELISIATNS